MLLVDQGTTKCNWSKRACRVARLDTTCARQRCLVELQKRLIKKEIIKSHYSKLTRSGLGKKLRDV